MALTDDEKLAVYLIFKVPPSTAIFDYKLNDLTTAEETVVTAAVVEWSDVQFDSDNLNVEGYSSKPEDKRQRLIEVLAPILDINTNLSRCGRG